MTDYKNRFTRCPSCGGTNDIADDACYLCGASPLVIECPACGAEIENPIVPTCPRCGGRYVAEHPGGRGGNGTGSHRRAAHPDR